MMKYSGMKCAILVVYIALCNANVSLVEESYVDTGKCHYRFLSKNSYHKIILLNSVGSLL